MRLYEFVVLIFVQFSASGKKKITVQAGIFQWQVLFSEQIKTTHSHPKASPLTMLQYLTF